MAGLGLIHKKIVELFPDIDEQYFADLLSPQSKFEFGEPGYEFITRHKEEQEFITNNSTRKAGLMHGILCNVMGEQMNDQSNAGA